MKLEKREKILLVIVAVLTFSYFYYNYFYSSINHKIAESRTKIAQKEKQIDDITKLKINNKKLKEALKVNTYNNEDIFSRLPQHERIPEIAYTMKQKADSCKLKMNSINFDNSEKEKSNEKDNTINKDGTIKSINVSMNLSGTYNDIEKFIHLIEIGDRVATVESIAMVPTENIISGNINAKFYYINSKESEELKYDFIKGEFGKSNIFN